MIVFRRLMLSSVPTFFYNLLVQILVGYVKRQLMYLFCIIFFVLYGYVKRQPMYLFCIFCIKYISYKKDTTYVSFL